jgi:hypothetical protein
MFAVGATFPLLQVFVFHLTGTDFLVGVGDSDKYFTPAIRLLETGTYGFVGDGIREYRPDLERLPGYPLFLAAVFKIFGIGNFLAVAVVQAFLFGGVTVGMAIAARSFRAEWMWPTALITAVWPNLVYRPTTIMTETLFTFYLVWGLCALLWVSKGNRVYLLLIGAGVCFGMAFMVRPTLLLFPLIVGPALVYLLKRDLSCSFMKSALLAAIPFVVMLAFTMPQYYQSYKYYGVAKFSTQSGINIINFVYPCLAIEWGCGARDMSYVKLAEEKFDAAFQKLPDEMKVDMIATDDLRSEVGIELIKTLPVPSILNSIVGSTLKSLFHNVSYEVMGRFGLHPIFFGEMKNIGFVAQVQEFLAAIAASAWMWLWAVFQVGLFVTRGVQFIGLFMLGVGEYRARIILLIAVCTAFMGVSFVFGSVRYRTAIEPVFVLLTVAGWTVLKNRLGRRSIA